MSKLVYYIYLPPLVMSALFSLKVFRLKWPQPFRYFSVFLVTTLFVELMANAWKFFLHKTGNWNYNDSNLWIYNSYLIPQYLFYLFFYSRILRSPKNKKTIIVLCIVYPLFALLNSIIIQGIHTINNYTLIASHTIVLYLTVSYFNQLLKEKEVVSLSSEPTTWISVGAFIFHLGSLPYFIFINYLNSINLSLSLSLFRIVLILNTFMYSMYLIAFLCKTHSQRSVPSPS